MKYIISLLSIVIASNVSAVEVTGLTTVGLFNSTRIPITVTLVSSATTSGAEIRKEAQLVLMDAQEYNQTGFLTAYLEKKIVDIRDYDNSLSETEALDVLIEHAQSILK